jgi:hypothetical protein
MNVNLQTGYRCLKAGGDTGMTHRVKTWERLSAFLEKLGAQVEVSIRT